MKLITTSLYHRYIEPRHSSADQHPTVILVHGLGADENDLAGLSHALDERLLFISVRAPFDLDYGGYTWYDFREAGQPEQHMFTTSCEKLSTFIDDALTHYPIDPRCLFLLGFSMGTVMSLAMALSRPQTFRGIIANSGYLADGTHLNYRWDELRGREFYIAHGTHDPLIPVQASRIMRDKLEEAQAKVEYHEFTMAHEINEESVNAMGQWLTERIDSRVE